MNLFLGHDTRSHFKISSEALAALQVSSKCSQRAVYAPFFRQPAPCSPTGSRVLKRLLSCLFSCADAF